MVCFLPGWIWDTLIPQVRSDLHDCSRGFRRSGRRLPALATCHGLLPGCDSFLRPVSGVCQLLPCRSCRLAALLLPAPVDPGQERPAAASLHVVLRTSRHAAQVVNLFAAACLIVVLLGNLSSISVVSIPGVVHPFRYLLGLQQCWGMFAPSSVKSTAWFIVPGILRDGRQIDLLPSVIHDNPHLFAEVDWGEPSDVRATFNREERWRKVFERLAEEDDPDILRSSVGTSAETGMERTVGPIRSS